ncbi:hypothetical protein BC2230_40902 [Burkholderia cepacia]
MVTNDDDEMRRAAPQGIGLIQHQDVTCANTSMPHAGARDRAVVQAVSSTTWTRPRARQRPPSIACAAPAMLKPRTRRT